jgi:hypothetical protein
MLSLEDIISLRTCMQATPKDQKLLKESKDGWERFLIL